MSGSPSIQHTTAFTLHAIGAALFVALVLLLVFRALFSPIDLFVHQNYIFGGLLRFAVSGFIFYGFSLALLRVCGLRTFWGVAYAASSWLLFVLAFYPIVPGSSGMMRRIADPESYEAARRTFEQAVQIFGAVVVIGFGVVQAVFLWYAFRQLRFGALSPE